VKATAIPSGDPDWMRVRGGPENLLNYEGYFCPIKVKPNNNIIVYNVKVVAELHFSKTN